MTPQPRRQALIAIAVGIALCTYVCALLAANFASASLLRHARIDRFAQDIERSRLVFGYFLAERRSDLVDLSSSVQVRAYFENRALGMSPEYGLNLSLVAMRARVADLVARSRIEDRPIYRRIAVVTDDLTVLVDSANDGPPAPADETWKARLAPVGGPAFTTAEEGRQLMALVPCVFKGDDVGRIVAWLDPDTIQENLLGGTAAPGRGVLIVDHERSVSLLSASAQAVDARDLGRLAELAPGVPLQVERVGGTSVIAARMRVPGTPFSTIGVIPTSELEGRLAPWHQLVGMAMLAVFVLGGAFFLLRLRARSMVLEARLDESVARGAEIEAKTHALEREIAERRRVEERLTAAMEAANAGSRAKSEFLANMSHEIRTPLNGVIGFADVLTDTELTAEQAEIVGIIRTSGQTLLSLIDDILDLSKIEAGKMPLESKDFDVRRLAHDVCDIVRPRILGQPVALVCSVDESVPRVVRGDPLRLRQLLLNLLGNAVKFTELGEIELSIGAEEASGCRIVLRGAVRDTGIGIQPDRLAGVFEKFAQADPSTTRRYGGTGLGLAICKKLVEAMDGEISVESVPGRGSRFRFRVTLSAGAEPSSSADPPSDVEPAEGSARVLLVEDNLVNQRLALTLLERAGHLVVVAANGREAVERVVAERGAFDLVLMDLQMPVMDGFDATAEIRARGFAGLPIIALTANAMKGDAERCIDRGLDGHLAKPIRREELLETVRRWAAARRSVASRG